MRLPLAPDDDRLAAAELRERLSAMSRLLEVTQSLAGEIDIDTVLRTIATAAREALDCDRATMYQYDAQRNELFTIVATELELDEIRHRLDDGVSGYAARERTVVNVADPASDPRWNSSVDERTGYETRNILAAPLSSTHDGALLGVLQLLNKAVGNFTEFDEQLLVAFGQHAAVALDRARLIAETRRRQAVEASLNVARGIQRGFMPQRLIDVPGYELATWWFPNEAVGGDYCDVLKLRDGRFGLVIADVSGHGLGPSLIMASVRAALRALTLEHSLPEVLLAMLGRALSDDLQQGRFITMVMAALDPVAHTVEYANAGHAPAVHYSARQDRFMPLESTGLPLGVLDRPDYPQGPPLSLAPDDIVVLCTDGIVEAIDEDDEQFGQSRLEQIIAAGKEKSAAEIVASVGRAVSAHYVGESPSDDLTILAIRRCD